MTKSRSNSAGTGGTRGKTRLTAEEKRANHNTSEANRRDKLQAAHDAYAEMVPGMSGQGASHAQLFKQGVAWQRAELLKKEKMKEVALGRGWTVEAFEAVYDGEEVKARQVQLRAASAQEEKK